MKKTLLLLAFLFLGSLITNAQEKTYSLTVTITGLNSDDGNLMIGVYNDKALFLKKQYKGTIAKITNKTSVVVFENLPQGEYAVSFVHDANNNKKMDTNFLGIPKEDYGCSNNAKGFMGPPKYDDAKFTLSENKSITITL